MSAAEIFREAKLISASDGSFANLAEAVNVSLREKKPFQRLEARYRTPAGEERTLDITVSSVHAPDSEVLGAACLGVACLINDRTEMTEIRRQQELHGEMSARDGAGSAQLADHHLGIRPATGSQPGPGTGAAIGV